MLTLATTVMIKDGPNCYLCSKQTAYKSRFGVSVCRRCQIEHFQRDPEEIERRRERTKAIEDVKQANAKRRDAELQKRLEEENRRTAEEEEEPSTQPTDEFPLDLIPEGFPYG